jgi:hypothetical protein
LAGLTEGLVDPVNHHNILLQDARATPDTSPLVRDVIVFIIFNVVITVNRTSSARLHLLVPNCVTSVRTLMVNSASTTEKSHVAQQPSKVLQTLEQYDQNEGQISTRKNGCTHVLLQSETVASERDVCLAIGTKIHVTLRVS